MLKHPRDDSFKKGLSNEPNFGRIYLAGQYLLSKPDPDFSKPDPDRYYCGLNVLLGTEILLISGLLELDHVQKRTVGGGGGGVTQILQRSILGYIGTELGSKLGDFHEDDAGC